jgi:hypothetical protein
MQARYARASAAWTLSLAHAGAEQADGGGMASMDLRQRILLEKENFTPKDKT